MRTGSPITTMPYASWPAIDRRLFEEACRPGDLLEPGGEASGWRPATVRLRKEGYGSWLAWLTHEGLLEPEVMPADRCTRERLKAFLLFLQQHYKPVSVDMKLQAMHRVLEVTCPDADISYVRSTLRRLDRRPEDRRARLRTVDELLDYGIALMADAEASDGPPMHRARKFRNGFIIAFLSRRPLRRRNVAGLRLGEQLVQVDGRWRIRIPGDETKTHRPIDEPMPDVLIPYLIRYLASFRPNLVPLSAKPWIDDGALFLSSHSGRALSGHAMLLTIGPLIAKRFGKPMSLHMFRDAVPTTLAIKAPKHVRIAAAINNHADYQMTERWYNLANAMDAATAHLANLTALRRKFRR